MFGLLLWLWCFCLWDYIADDCLEVSCAFVILVVFCGCFMVVVVCWVVACSGIILLLIVLCVAWWWDLRICYLLIGCADLVCMVLWVVSGCLCG